MVDSLRGWEMQWDSVPLNKTWGQVRRRRVADWDPDAEAGAREVDFPNKEKDIIEHFIGKFGR